MSTVLNRSAAAASQPAPCALDAGEIGRHLQEQRPGDGGAWQVRVVETTGSTNSDLLATIRGNGYAGPLLLAAERQTAGRGRLGRAWSSTASASLTASFALRIARPMSRLDGVTLVCGLAACDAIAAHGVEACLKWPNDLLFDGRKLGGILVETVPLADATVLVVGIGINVTHQHIAGGDDARPIADLRSAGAHALDRNRLAAALGLALQTRLATFTHSGFASCRAEWNRRDAYRDRAVSLRAGADPCITGIARGVGEDGVLLVDTTEGRRRIVSGDLSLRLAASP